MGMKMGTNYFLFSVSLPDVVLCCQVIAFVESCLNIKEEISRGSTPVVTKHYRSSTTTTKKRNCYLRGFEYVRKLGFEASGAGQKCRLQSQWWWGSHGKSSSPGFSGVSVLPVYCKWLHWKSVHVLTCLLIYFQSLWEQELFPLSGNKENTRYQKKCLLGNT